MPNTSFDYNRVSKSQMNTMRTAFLTAFPKIFCGISFSHEIFKEAINISFKNGFYFQPNQFIANLAVELEARHKALNLVLNKYIKLFGEKVSIIELGAGLSPRRLEFNNFPYIELDYKAMIKMKKSIYKNMNRVIEKKELLAIDLSSLNDLNKFLLAFKKMNIKNPIIVISEGLFWYLTRDSMKNLVKYIHDILSLSSGVWITGDCPVNFETAQEQSYRTIIAESSQKKMDQPFSSFIDFDNFFKSANFNVKSSKMEDWINPSDLYSAKLFSLSAEDILDRLGTYTNIAELKISI